ncbi:ABC transporter ATP-binding protein [Candidatus Saccharibacteria bacterium]|jgi:putative ABC transport system ATP-binding protein|nr:ABC transporter ATP-binding protein [Candidatus Saccharibacteria bacterium]MBP9489778.1 ABC transporter ATP-binding protein [Candidatus Saccharibacteria bacterium]MBP9552345.1 ABC transporter ATP-binding protein [Candidatus Saccharibacteria bacterium]
MNEVGNYIEVENLVKKYKKQTVLNLQNLKIPKGKFIAIIGESGSGKSTLLNLLSGLDKPTSGKVFVDGQDLSKLGDRKLSKFRSKKIGFIFQFFYLQPYLTVLQNIEAAAFLSKVSKTVRRKQAETLTKIVGLSDKSKSYPRELSGGQIQRVAIARSLINSPDILFADEPTGNLDSENSLQVISLLRNIQQETNMTLIIVTHDEKIASQADSVIRLNDGEIYDQN